MFGKNPVPEMGTKMVSASQIVGFLNEPFHQDKLMKQPDFLHVDTNLQKLQGNLQISLFVLPLLVLHYYNTFIW